MNGSERFHSYTQIRKFEAERMKFSSIYPVYEASVVSERKTLSSTTNALCSWSNRTIFFSFGNETEMVWVRTKMGDSFGSEF